jgi:hypothetical protein
MIDAVNRLVFGEIFEVCSTFNREKLQFKEKIDE